MPFWVVLLLKGISGLMILGSVLIHRRTRKFLSEATRTHGTVVDLEVGTGGDETTYYSVFEFTDGRGEKHRLRSGVASAPPAHKVGQKVEVLYRPNEPEKAKIESFFELWFGSTLLLIIGAMLLVVITIVAAVEPDDVDAPDGNLAPPAELQSPPPTRPSNPPAPAPSPGQA
ncbi:MAG TPA: DUF3592 domain-containing protein [Planctomycetota bacterium]|nr:DUF3592 domain-containing protein [Planctomycetota bacterium]